MKNFSARANVKYAVAAVAAIAFVTAAYFVVGTNSAASCASFVSKPKETTPYIFINMKNGGLPGALVSALTTGQYAPLEQGSARRAVFEAARLAKENALLFKAQGRGVEISAAMRLEARDAALLKEGELPASMEKIFGSASLSGDKETGIFVIEASGLTSPVYCATKRGIAVMADGKESVEEALKCFNDKKKSFASASARAQKEYGGFAEISDGGNIARRAGEDFTVKLNAAWRRNESADAKGAKSEIRWEIADADVKLRAFLSSFSPKTWNVKERVIPVPLLFSCGVSAPNSKSFLNKLLVDGSPIGEIAKRLEIDEQEAKEILSGQTTFSVGGQNRLLWFSLPGFLVEITGREELLNDVTASFWDNMFFGVSPRKMEGYEYGGTSSVPFSVIGAANGTSAVFGLVTQRSLASASDLSGVVGEDEAVIGWLAADLPKIGGALSEMTRMSGFFEDGGDEPYSDGYGGLGGERGEEENYEPLQPDLSFTPFDQGITDSFGEILKRLGAIVIVWEKPMSGRAFLYDDLSLGGD